MSVSAPNSITLFLARFFALDWRYVRAGSFFLSIIVYALFGSPTPDDFGFTEGAVAALLIFAIGAGGASNALPWFGSSDEDGWQGPARLLLFYGLSVPLVTAFCSGTAPGFISRDLIAFLFLFLPLFLIPLLHGFMRPYLLIFSCLGVLFALRSLGHIAGAGLPSILRADDLFYLANSPAVLFASIFMAGAGIIRFCTLSVRGVLIGAALFIIVLVPVTAMMAGLQRASLGLFALSMFVLLTLQFVKTPMRALPLLVLVAIGLAFFLPVIEGGFDLLLSKTQEVGGNRRLSELAAVWEAVSLTPLTAIFGLGWGADFQSPAVGMMHVHFTHSLLSAALLKTGVLGVVFLGIYLVILCRRLLNSALSLDFSVFLALFCPLLIDVFLYAAYKSYDFGLLLLMIGIISASVPAGDKNTTDSA